MIGGHEEYSGLRLLLYKLDLSGDNTPDAFDVANYVVRHSGMGGVYWDSNGVDEFEPTDDEEDAMFLLENGYDKWMERAENILMGEDNESV